MPRAATASRGGGAKRRRLKWRPTATTDCLLKFNVVVVVASASRRSGSCHPRGVLSIVVVLPSRALLGLLLGMLSSSIVPPHLNTHYACWDDSVACWRRQLAPSSWEKKRSEGQAGRPLPPRGGPVLHVIYNYFFARPPSAQQGAPLTSPPTVTHTQTYCLSARARTTPAR